MPFITQGKTNLKYILIVVILAVIAGGGILGYQYWWMPKREVPLPEVKELGGEPIESLKEYSNLFYSFKYPNYYKIVGEIINAEHKEAAGGRDIYGLTSVQMNGNLKGKVYSVSISSSPNWNHMSVAEALALEQKDFVKFRDDDKIEITIIAGKDAVRKFRPSDNGRFGSDIVIIPTENYGYSIEITWVEPSANNPTNEARIDFENLLQSFIIKTQ